MKHAIFPAPGCTNATHFSWNAAPVTSHATALCNYGVNIKTLQYNVTITIDNRVLKRDRKRNNVTSQNAYISIGIPCSTSRTYSLRLLRLYQRETNCCNDRIL